MSPEKIDQGGEKTDFLAQDERIFPAENIESIVMETLSVLLRDRDSIKRATTLIKGDPDLNNGYEEAKKIEITLGHFTVREDKVVLEKRPVITTMVNEIVRGDDEVLKTKLKILVDKVRKGS